MKQQYQAFHDQLKSFIPDTRLISDPLRTLAYGTDASFYRLIPQIVVRVESADEVSRIVKLASDSQIPVTFRAAGTSLSGQAITDSVLIQLGDGWKGYEISDDASSIKLQPGVIGGHANKYLAPFNKKIGPDPASINAAKIGGIAANNASGMCCGTAQNSYRTLKSMKLVLSDGTQLDTGSDQSLVAFRESHKGLLDALDALARQTRENDALRQRINHKYRLKNTTGYSLNALVDYEDPIDILQHLMIGSEGTLGFMSEITYHTVDEFPDKASALIFFDTVRTTCEAVAILKSTPVSAVELMDRAGLRSVENKEGMPDFIRELPEDAAALLVETRAPEAGLLADQVEQIKASIAHLQTSKPVEFTTNPEEYAKYWAIRKGLFPAVGAVRMTGTTVIIEDVAFPVEQLADAVHDLHQIFEKYHYDEALIFGHALEGNLHFVFTQAFDNDEELARYEGLMDDVGKMVVEKYDGSLKAEHGTGRNMAPYVEMEWGTDAYALMWELKELLDPKEILNPGVILNRNKQVHLENLKPMPAADEIVDKCIECGFCEPTCPSRDLTLSPRQRIVLWREIARLEATGEDAERLAELRKEYQYQGTDTCAACGLCSTTCPVGINTGNLTRSIRSRNNENHTKLAQWVADHYGGITKTTKAAFKIADATHAVLGTKIMSAVTGFARKASGGTVQQWTPSMPTAAPKIDTHKPITDPNAPKVVYLPSCASRTMGPARGDEDRTSLADKTEALLRKAGFEVIYPDDMDKLCCGMPFQSKGMFEAADSKSSEVERILMQATNNGELPVYSDTSPCTLRLRENISERIKLYDTVDFIDQFLLDRLVFEPINEPVALHITCSATRMGQADKLKRIMNACSSEVVIPDQITCCGFAGDKGFSTPELNASALRTLKDSVSSCKTGYSTSRTCEIGLSHHSGIDYKSIVYLVDRVTQPKLSATASTDENQRIQATSV
ncbi:FAD-binding and (Fe-S)-binding domain-containing protein [Pontibacterium granulatum]|uniref:FAD-binding and (Fe-S)-binding domain-containing protein n=1 Tax=Pontibacterium granulatum TaxID=2036029 RepID=UPI00249C55AF|nr:FAD-binding and (Fe-S)-binding domain-containing protein [Pontibacterium granulatum]MDI3322746.1 FAD-binding and (Fe-S)-binding domain-containing protein [Pontibacterium granulatum]